MAFASAWIREKAIFPEFISENPADNTGIIIVVPAYNEPDVTIMLDSLSGCVEPECGIEIIIVVNAPVNAPADHIEGNRKAIVNIKNWSYQNPDCFFRLFYVEPEKDIPDWGVGLARKTGMDEALRRFNRLNKPEGVILCLDADCTVENNYLTSVYRELLKDKKHNACSIYFEHPLNGTEQPEIFYRFIILYELHLRYYYQALKYSGFPYAFQTIGSAMAVKALAYMKAGGMNRRKAGEDFYFIQKLSPSGGYFYLNSTTVHPSPRPSYRVPFGTGATMQKLSMIKEPVYYSYDFRAFRELKSTFSMLDEIFRSGDQLYEHLPEGIKLFINKEEWTGKILEIKENTSNFQAFEKRFFSWFNMFRIVKYLNFVHKCLYGRVPVEQAAGELLSAACLRSVSNCATDLLHFYRLLEKGS